MVHSDELARVDSNSDLFLDPPTCSDSAGSIQVEVGSLRDPTSGGPPSELKKGGEGKATPTDYKGDHSMDTAETDRVTSSMEDSPGGLIHPVHSTFFELESSGDVHDPTDPFFSRTCIPNKEICLSAVSQSVFSVVSYDVMAWNPEPELPAQWRQDRLLEELKFLKGDIVCLQSVTSEYFAILQSFFNALVHYWFSFQDALCHLSIT